MELLFSLEAISNSTRTIFVYSSQTLNGSNSFDKQHLQSSLPLQFSPLKSQSLAHYSSNLPQLPTSVVHFSALQPPPWLDSYRPRIRVLRLSTRLGAIPRLGRQLGFEIRNESFRFCSLQTRCGKGGCPAVLRAWTGVATGLSGRVRKRRREKRTGYRWVSKMRLCFVVGDARRFPAPLSATLEAMAKATMMWLSAGKNGSCGG